MVAVTQLTLGGDMGVVHVIGISWLGDWLLRGMKNLRFVNVFLDLKIVENLLSRVAQNTGHSVTFEFQINNECYFFSMFQILQSYSCSLFKENR